MKPMNVKKGLKRIWVLGSGVWIVFLIYGYTVSSDLDTGGTIFWTGILGLAIWWGLYWGISGFLSAEDKSDENK